MRLRTLLLGLVALMTAGPALAESNPYGELPFDFQVQKVPEAPVYYARGFSAVPDSDNAGHTSNAGFVVTEEGVVVFDALGTPALGYALLQEIRKVTDKPVRRVVVSHYHADHIYGLQAFREHTEGAEVWAQRLTKDYFDPQRFKKGEDADRRLAQRREALSPWVDEDTYLVEPDHLFGEKASFEVGETTFELRHMGPAHAPGDSIMVVPEMGVVFGGDIIYRGRIPFLDSPKVDTKRWQEGLAYLTRMEPKPTFIIPGHGEASANVQEAVDFTSTYLGFVRNTMGTAARNFRSFAQAYEQADWSKYEGMPAFEASNRGNAYRVYLEMEEEVF
ncbi:Glyoxylase, beta-lactamase superfamily II [Thiohalorhabdus denitrificans]|uniref:Glyoxylase, beta-lactamase superfamily II n=2 Tax=Thiohalorhabdus denitrificans TaxID=381306 RepID=A0A1G5HM46_9GAMM|nr:MBL fold metallo-hydrolase [Thiohalorhabdus denitrificans]SCY64843.1 Glyoxylase, beta-lactamase superfamily II [Thiohalorhabdus denitrificans]